MLIPMKIYPRDSTIHVSEKSQRIMAFCNCVSGGVFLGVCFVGLMPFCQEKFEASFLMKGMVMPYPFSELSVVLGFFLVLFLEQSLHSFQSRRKNEDEVREYLKAPNEYLVYTSDSTGSDDSGSEGDGNQMGIRLNAPALIPTSDTNAAAGSTSAEVEGPQAVNGDVSATDTTTLMVGASSRSRSQTQRRRHTRSTSHHSHDGHGHSHAIDIFSQNTGLRCAVLLIALSIHALFEGMAVGLQDELAKLVNLFIGVIVHECLVSFAMGISLAKQRLRVTTVVKLALLLCAMIPIGISLGLVIGVVHNFAGSITSAVLQALAAGTFIYVIFMEILPAELNVQRDRLLKVFFFFFGFVLIACIQVATGHEH